MSEEIKHFQDEFLRHLAQVRKDGLDAKGEYDKQQFLYTKYAQVYDEANKSMQYNAPKFVADKIKELFPNNKDVKILDYGCGTGTIAEYLVKYGYNNSDGLDPCKEMLDNAREKKVMVNLFELSSK